MVTKDTFSKIFPDSFVNKLKESIIPHDSKIIKKDVIDELYSDLVNFKYHPSTPRDYIIINKANYVSRIIPTFQPKDYFLFYFCCKILEDEIALNRVEGTYGGWRLGNKIRLREEYDELELVESAPSNSFNPFMWTEHWQDFQKKAFQANNTGDYKVVLKYDIANFYDNINIGLLAKKLYSVCPGTKSVYVEILIHFLNNWNKKFQGYSKKSVGLPQDEISDCSRLLANFYLQDYDQFIRCICDKENARYLRYADDQLIYTKDIQSARFILFEASKYLSRIGLNINTSKVNFFENPEEFNQYWAFEIFELLGDSTKTDNINKGIQTYISWKEKRLVFKEFSVLKRILNLNFSNFEMSLKHKIFSYLFEKDFLATLPCWALSKIYKQLNQEEKKDFIKVLEDISIENHFNSYHYNLKLFYKKNSLPFDEGKLDNLIHKLKI